jgi:perosamine synthetase
MSAAAYSDKVFKSSLANYKNGKVVPKDCLWNGRDYLFFYNGKTAIHYIINKYKLTRTDEVCIFTSTNKNYVSTCVTGTIFNYCKLSRVITKHTKMLYIIHEFGIPNPETIKIVKEGKKLGIPVVEDCAHTIDSSLKNIRVGNYGDYAIYSLPKHFPISNGGLLVGKGLKPDKEFYNEKTALLVSKNYNKYIGYLSSLSQKRKEIYRELKEIIISKGYTIYEFDTDSTPFYFLFESKFYNEIIPKMEREGIIVGRIYIKNWIAIPINQLMDNQHRNKVFKKLKSIL